ncbi:MAG: DUF1080 domain-containing protein [Planctomycetota bacterium]
MIRILLASVLGATLLLPGCRDAEAPVAAPAADGWRVVFDGKSLDGWTPKIKGQPLGEDPLGTFRVRDGVIAVVYDDYERFEGRFGHLFLDGVHENYDFEFEYRFLGDQTPGGPGWAFRNSGAMVHGQSAESMRVDQDFPVSIEFQILGGDGKNARPTGNLCTPGTHVVIGDELVTRHVTDSSSPTYAGDGWVRARVEVRGDTSIRHFIEDQLVLEYRAPQLDPGDADARGLIEAAGGEVALKRGTISLQAESHPCEFRRLRIRSH